MKIKLFTDKSFDNKKVRPRDIRNIMMSALRNEEISSRIGNKGKSKNTQSLFVFPKPRPRSFEILSYGNDLEALAEIEVALVGKSFNLGGKDVLITNCEWENEGYENIRQDLVSYKTRTPIVITSNSVEHKLVYNLARQDDDSELKRYIVSKIKEMIIIQVKEFFNKDIDLSDLIIKINDFNKITVKITDDCYEQAVYIQFMSNYRLPRFLGFKNGLGFGEILDAFTRSRIGDNMVRKSKNKEERGE